MKKYKKIHLIYEQEKTQEDPITQLYAFDASKGQTATTYIQKILDISKTVIKNVFSELNSDILNAAYQTIIAAYQRNPGIFMDIPESKQTDENGTGSSKSDSDTWGEQCLITTYTKDYYTQIITEAEEQEQVQDGQYVLIVSSDKTISIVNKNDPATKFTADDYKKVNRWFVTHNKDNAYIDKARAVYKQHNDLSFSKDQINKVIKQVLQQAGNLCASDSLNGDRLDAAKNQDKIEKSYTAIESETQFSQLQSTLQKLAKDKYMDKEKIKSMKQNFLKCIICFIIIGLTYAPTRQDIKDSNDVAKAKREEQKKEAERKQKLQKFKQWCEQFASRHANDYDKLAQAADGSYDNDIAMNQFQFKNCQKVAISSWWYENGTQIDTRGVKKDMAECLKGGHLWDSAAGQNKTLHPQSVALFISQKNATDDGNKNTEYRQIANKIINDANTLINNEQFNKEADGFLLQYLVIPTWN